jgi:dTDP-4-dehydrorhamnose 3,5-epimerase-like enzyme
MAPITITRLSQEDERGFSARPFQGISQSSVFNFHVVSLNPGAVRGNHFHPRQKEFIIFLGSQGKLVTVDSVTKDRSETIIEGKGCPLITVPSKVIHAIKNISNQVCYLLCYNDTPLDLEKDVIREIILT